jgi:formylglycine-generating enzyme required for sulfatase activity
MAVTSANLNLIACYGGNSQEYLQHYRRTEPVGSYLPNAWGLYDMIGNVWEWTLDWYQESTEGLDPEIGAATGEKKVARGGCAGNASQFCRCAYRDPNSPSANDTGIGFRICLNLP